KIIFNFIVLNLLHTIPNLIRNPIDNCKIFSQNSASVMECVKKFDFSLEQSVSYKFVMDLRKVLTIMNMWYKYTTEYYSALKKNDVMKFTGKWMELENTIVREVTQTQKAKHVAFNYFILPTDSVENNLKTEVTSHENRTYELETEGLTQVLKVATTVSITDDIVYENRDRNLGKLNELSSFATETNIQSV
ncbi:hypothetical protein STEG23_010869, partial [Scotinomys teguina]